MMVKFDGISGPAAQGIAEAYERLPGYLAACLAALEPGQEDWDRYTTWFDANEPPDQGRVECVRNVITTLADFLQTKTITFANATGSELDQYMVEWDAVRNESRPTLQGYVLAPGPAMMAEGVEHVGSGIRILVPARTAANQSELCATIFHELAHKSGFGILDITPDPYDPGACQARAQSSPEQAIHNAENYTLFFKDVNGI
jgi:hypothetical protein